MLRSATLLTALASPCKRSSTFPNVSDAREIRLGAQQCVPGSLAYTAPEGAFVGFPYLPGMDTPHRAFSLQTQPFSLLLGVSPNCLSFRHLLQNGKRSSQNTRQPQSSSCASGFLNLIFCFSFVIYTNCIRSLNSSFTVDDFKHIFYMEWAHRILGRVVGLAFVLPLTYYAVRRKITPGLTRQFAGIAVLLGLQGALGWYMVKSGLEDSIMTTPGAVPRVSQYRLAAHLGAAFVLYSAMFATGHNIIRDWKFVRKGIWSGLEGSAWENVLRNPVVRSFRTKTWAITALVFLTAISGIHNLCLIPQEKNELTLSVTSVGAFVAGLDAGLLYNEFPLMGGRLAPPSGELMNPAYTTRPDKSDMWRNIFENPTTVQFNHRVLAMSTYTATGALYALTRTSTLKAALPAATRRIAAMAFGVANFQVLLGISTLLYLVPVPLAAAHQAGSVALLSMMITLGLTLRRPGAVAQLWRQRALANACKSTQS
ncbi:cytochrome oxidase assembly protein-domain-containing protein [Phellopilus nigrolimitatus]|nr:cytochrome oxidase assembly protein-domain-containing protein [Phellopilus nigrolimitatus]